MENIHIGKKNQWHFGVFQMSSEKKLAIGIPTYKRPDFAIKLVKNLTLIDIYDQIIVSSNSKETELVEFIESINNPRITFNQQKNNVGMARNYFDIIKICECEYLHIISDEDEIYDNNVKIFYNELKKNINSSLVIVGVNNKDDVVYKDSSWQKNKYLKDSLGETAHIGSSIINRKLIDEKMLNILYRYAAREGAVYPTTLAALAAYSVGGTIEYFKKPLVKMGDLHKVREISGHSVYGFEPRLHQYMSLYKSLKKIKFKKKSLIFLYGIYYFTHHALQDSIRKFNEKPFTEFLGFFKKNNLKNINDLLAYLILITGFYFYYYYFKFRLTISKALKKKTSQS